MNIIQKAQASFDAFQQKHPVLAFPIATFKRYGDDKVGQQAALITYYGFLALFPLILAFITIVNILVHGDPQLQATINSRVFQYFPALGQDLQGNVHSLKGSGIALVLELLVLLYGARGVAVTLQDAFNHVWHADREHKPNFVLDNLRSLAMIIATGVGITIGTIIGYALSIVLDIGLPGVICITLVNLLVTIGLFLAVFRLGTSSRIPLRALVLGAIIAGVGLLIIQHFGTYIMAHQLPKLRGAYGSFALTLGLLFWIYLQAQTIMYALVVTATRKQHDWPKKLFD